MRARVFTIYEKAQAGLDPAARDALVEGLRTVIANLTAAECAADAEPERRPAAAGARA